MEQTSHTGLLSQRRDKVWLGVGVIAALLFIAGVSADLYTLRLIVKPLPVLCLLLWMQRFLSGPYKFWISLGFLFSLGGDMLLEIHNSLFLYGLISFLIAHLCYIVAFSRRYRGLRLTWFLPFALWGGGVYVFLFSKLGSMTVPVGVYVAVICVMMWRATTCLGWNEKYRHLAWAGMLGAISFAISDTMIAFNKFYEPFVAARYGIIVLYWLGQWGIAYSAAESPSSPALSPVSKAN